jgi:AcrR family transcriptional regulator
MDTATTARRPPPPRRQEAEQGRRRVSQADRRRVSDRKMLSAAMRVIAAKGAAGATLAEIGVAAGYSRGLPAERFGHKIALLEALVDFMESWFQARVAETLAGKTGIAAVLARIAEHLDSAVRSPTATAALYSLYVESLSAVPELRPRIAALSEGFAAGFRDHLREGQRAGEIAASIDCGEFAAIIVGAIRGLIIQSLVDQRATDLGAIKAPLLALVSVSLAAKPRPTSGRKRRVDCRR